MQPFDGVHHQGRHFEHRVAHELPESERARARDVVVALFELLGRGCDDVDAACRKEKKLS